MKGYKRKLRYKVLPKFLNIQADNLLYFNYVCRIFAPVLERVPVGLVFRKEIDLNVFAIESIFTRGVAAREDRRHFGKSKPSPLTRKRLSIYAFWQ